MQSALSPLVYVVAFLAIVLLVQGLSVLLFSSRDRKRQVNRRLTMLESGMEPAAVYAALVRTPAAGIMAKTHLGGIVQRLETNLRQSDLSMPASRFAAIVGASAVTIWMLSLVVARLGFAPALLSLFASGGLAVFGAGLWLGHRRRARLKLLEGQMPTALDVMIRGLRAGYPVIAAIRLAAHEMGDPIGSEFGLVMDETTYGLELKDALTNLARRTGSPDAHFLAVSIGIQAQTGGNLAEILENLAKVIRGRATLAKRVHALASEGRASAMILSLLPVFLVGFMAIFRPEYYTSKFSDPVFWPIVAAVCVLYVIGRAMIYRITHFKF